MPGLDMPIQITSADQHLRAELALVRRVADGVKTDMFGHVRRIAETFLAELAPERFESGMNSHVNFQSVFPGVKFPAKFAKVALVAHLLRVQVVDDVLVARQFHLVRKYVRAVR